MKLTKYLCIVAIFGAALFVSCTPESVEDDNTEQQVDPNKVGPPAKG